MKFAILVLSLAAIWAEPAHAYIDPGSSGMIMQLLLGGIAGGLVLLRFYWAKLISMFRVRPTKKDASGKSEVAHRPIERDSIDQP